MVQRLTPGAYVDEVGAGARPIQGESTSTCGFIGEAARGIPDRPTFITGFGQFQRSFGGHRNGEAGYLAHAVDSFFQNGGTRAYVVRVLAANATLAQSAPVVARGRDPWGLERDVLRIRARGAGEWARALRVHIEPSSGFQNEAFAIRVEWIENGRARNAEPRFDNLRMDPQHENYAVRVINEVSQFIELEDLLQAESDLVVRTTPPLPEETARLALNSPDGTFNVAEGAELQFRWIDGGNPSDDHFASVTFPDTDDAFSSEEMTNLLAGALDGDYRVLGTVEPATLTSADGPYDISATNTLTLTIDAVDTVITLVDATAAELDLGAGDFNAVAAGADVTLAIDGGAPVTYTLVAGDAAADATVAEMVTVINREFAGVSAADDGGNLVLTSDSSGLGSSIAVTGALAAAAGDPALATGEDGVQDNAAATAEEVARLINAETGGTPYLAAANGDALRLVQVDMADHTLTVSATTEPIAVFAQDETANGPNDTGRTEIAVEPAVATRAYRSIRVLEGETQFDADGTARTLRLRVTSGGNTEEVTVDMASDDQLSPAELAAAFEAADGFADLAGIELEAAGEFLTASAGPTAAGTVVEFLEDDGDLWRDAGGLDGAAGAIVDNQDAITLTVSEPFLPGIPRISGPIFPNPRVSGRDDGSPMAPGLRPALTDDDPIRLIGGTDGTGPVGVDRYRGTVTATGRRTGLRSFEGGPIAMLAVPGRNSAPFVTTAMTWADDNDVFLILDLVGSIDRTFETSADDVRQYAEGLVTRSNNTAGYYPWPLYPAPSGLGQIRTRYMPPSGSIAGIFARIDGTRGVAKAPAGIEAQVGGAIGLQHRLIDADQDLLNPVGVNCLRQLAGAGLIVWGSRTLAVDQQWRYVPVRRTALFLKRSLRRGLRWAVFEPNDQILWEQIRINVQSFMLGLFQQRMFQGATPDEAFLVKCDRDTNPQELVDQGQVTVQVQFAPLKPAEFVLVELSQKSLVA